MCKKCKPHSKYWVHIADSWDVFEREEMRLYLDTDEIPEDCKTEMLNDNREQSFVNREGGKGT
jgi:hypothetical protein